MLCAIDAVGIRGHGGAAVLSELLEWLPRARPNWQWHVFLLGRRLREFENISPSGHVRFEYTHYGNYGASRLLWVNVRLPARLLAIRADIVFSFANIGARKPSIPQVVFVQQANAFLENHSQLSSLKHLRMKFLRSQILAGARASNAVIVQTQAMREGLGKYNDRLYERTHVIPSGYRSHLNVARVRPEITSLVDRASKPRLIYVSHPSEHKNHEKLLEAMPGILRVFPKARLMLTLEKSKPINQRYVKFVEKMHRMSRELGIEGALVWLGVIDADEVHYVLSSSDLMVFPSLSESFGLGLVEAMAAGCPIAAADLDYAHNVAEDAAVYFDPLDTSALAECVIKTLRDQGTMSRLRRVGMGRRGLYSYEHISARLADIFESSAGDRSKAVSSRQDKN